jgi:N4-bis(aminopropyl)spermidine synthase
MTLLDFDDRLLEIGSLLAHRFKFSDRFTSRSYNVFDPLPRELDKDFDAFYTNPPYGASNSGASARLFITRGCELTKGEKAEGYILLPEDQKRSWTRTAMLETQRFLTDHNWVVTACVPQLHRYHLDDDKGLKSSFLCVAYGAAGSPSLQMPWQGRAVEQTEIPHFYGKGVSPPFPRYLALDRHENSSLDNLSEGEKS